MCEVGPIHAIGFDAYSRPFVELFEFISIREVDGIVGGQVEEISVFYVRKEGGDEEVLVALGSSSGCLEVFVVTVEYVD